MYLCFNKVSQPGPYDGGTSADKIAVLERYVPLYRGTQLADCPVAGGVEAAVNRVLRILRPSYEMRFYKAVSQFNVVDCAVARPVSPDIVSDEIIELGKVAGVGEIKQGMTVQKSGRSSGVTSGEISATGVTLKVELSGDESGWFSDQVVVDMLCKPGDSGSLVLDGENKVVGLLFAGSDTHCIINRIQNVMDLLQVQF